MGGTATRGVLVVMELTGGGGWGGGEQPFVRHLERSSQPARENSSIERVYWELRASCFT